MAQPVVTHRTTSFDDTNATAYTVASHAYVDNKPYLLAVGGSRTGATPDTPTVAGGGITWVEIDNQIGGSSNTKKLILFRGCVTSGATTGTLTITFANALNGCTWQLVDSTADATGTNGSASIVQSAKNSTTGATSLTVTLAAFAANSAAYAAFFSGLANDFTYGTYSELGEADGASPPITISGAWHTADADAVATASVSTHLMGIAVELKEAGAAAAVPTRGLTLVGVR